jgi:hypothetical protein
MGGLVMHIGSVFGPEEAKRKYARAKAFAEAAPGKVTSKATEVWQGTIGGLF